jgi:hypothetical protein
VATGHLQRRAHPVTNPADDHIRSRRRRHGPGAEDRIISVDSIINGNTDANGDPIAIVVTTVDVGTLSSSDMPSTRSLALWSSSVRCDHLLCDPGRRPLHDPFLTTSTQPGFRHDRRSPT